MKKHILLIDDETEILEVLKQVLTLEGYRVSAVTSAAEAKKLATTDRPDLVSTDLQLEDSDGLQLVEQLKAMYHDLPVILLTGVFFDPKVIEGSLSKKVSGYLSKTAPLKEFIQEVKRYIGG